MSTDQVEINESQMPTWSQLWDRISELAVNDGEWAGSPPLATSQKLVLEPRYPVQNVQGLCLDNLGGEQPESYSEETEEIVRNYDLINEWWCEKRSVTIHVWRHKTSGKSRSTWIQDQGWPTRWEMFMDGFDPACSKTALAEAKAMETLSGMISKHAFNLYLNNGAFLETSPRSKLVYVFRKGKPTVAMSVATGSTHVLTALCLHPIGYYEETFLGVMAPTDDVIAHLLMIRGDERKFWGKANHHPPHLASSGI